MIPKSKISQDWLSNTMGELVDSECVFEDEKKAIISHFEKELESISDERIQKALAHYRLGYQQWFAIFTLVIVQQGLNFASTWLASYLLKRVSKNTREGKENTLGLALFSNVFMVAFLLVLGHSSRETAILTTVNLFSFSTALFGFTRFSSLPREDCVRYANVLTGFINTAYLLTQMDFDSDALKRTYDVPSLIIIFGLLVGLLSFLLLTPVQENAGQQQRLRAS